MTTKSFLPLFSSHKPVIAMAHLPALPGTPCYDAVSGMQKLIDVVGKDVEVLEKSGVDAIMFCNENDRPYVFTAGIEQIAAMTRVVTELKPTLIPFGVDFLWDPMATIAIANATGASFVREVLTGTYESDMGLWSPDAGRVMRFRQNIGGDNILMFFNIVPEFAASLGGRPVAQRALSAVTSCLADAILVSGVMAGSEAKLDHFYEIKEAVHNVPVMVNTGANVDNIATYLEVADGVIVGSSLKVDGVTWNPVDPERVEEFMDRVRETRAKAIA